MLNVKNSTEYEKVAQQVYQAILATEEVETIEVLHNVQITGRSGVVDKLICLIKSFEKDLNAQFS
ncbi:hypothetical protein YA0002_24360 [Pseudomonas cichorii]|uniref:hypothetical protein n=1 Tax=Pseudomonas cichorii TaxID=36746 RepID=UPI0018E5C5FB|nr:hypothetical protein [Pseudomonas cichorii]MBI6855902.1 hypothetical protein [Pseudomonas cichorii]